MAHDLKLCRSGFRPNEADSPLTADSEAVLTVSIAFQRFELIAWRRAKEVQSLSRMDLRELSPSNSACVSSHLNERITRTVCCGQRKTPIQCEPLFRVAVRLIGIEPGVGYPDLGRRRRSQALHPRPGAGQHRSGLAAHLALGACGIRT